LVLGALHVAVCKHGQLHVVSSTVSNRSCTQQCLQLATCHHTEQTQHIKTLEAPSTRGLTNSPRVACQTYADCATRHAQSLQLCAAACCCCCPCCRQCCLRRCLPAASPDPRLPSLHAGCAQAAAEACR
jgi:hypothetical protein